MIRSFAKRYYAVIGCLLGTFALIFYLAASAQNNTIQACFKNGTGALRRVNSASDCANSETPISWNITGPQGFPGPQGEMGPPGALSGVSGRWVGTYTITSSQCSNFGTNTLEIIFIQLPAGALTGSTEVGATGISNVASSSVFGQVTGSNITFDSGGRG